MRLNGYFKAGPLEAAYITAVLAIPNLRITHKIEFLIDTGATRTAILDRDATTIGITYSRLSRMKAPLLGLGGVVGTYAAKNAEIYFKADNSSEHKEAFQELVVVKHINVDGNYIASEFLTPLLADAYSKLNPCSFSAAKFRVYADKSEG